MPYNRTRASEELAMNHLGLKNLEGVLPAISKLTQEQAMYYFLLGYTAKIPGTEVGITEPQATFSPCFGQAPLRLRQTVGTKNKTGQRDLLAGPR